MIEPDALVTSAPKSLLALVASSPANPGAATCPVVTRPIVFLMPVALVNIDTPSCSAAVCVTSAKRTCRSTCWLWLPPGSCSRFTTLAFDVVAPAISAARSDTALLETCPERMIASSLRDT